MYLFCAWLQFARYAASVSVHILIHKTVMQYFINTLQGLWWIPGTSGGRIHGPAIWNGAAERWYPTTTSITSDCQQTPSRKRKYGSIAETEQAVRDTRSVSQLCILNTCVKVVTIVFATLWQGVEEASSAHALPSVLHLLKKCAQWQAVDVLPGEQMFLKAVEHCLAGLRWA
jgi:hypothetical protein